MSTPGKYLLLVQDHGFLIPLPFAHTHVTFSHNTSDVSTGWEPEPYFLQRAREPWMSVSTTISSGSSSSFSLSSPSSTTTSSLFQPPPANFSGPFPPPPPVTNTTVTTVVPTNIVTTTALTRIRTTSTNYVLSTSTSVATQPAAIATEATSLLNSSASLARTNLIITIVLGSLTVLLLLLILILFCLYTRRKRQRDRDDNEGARGEVDGTGVEPPLPPNSGSIFISQEPEAGQRLQSLQSLPRVSQTPLSINMALSSNPYSVENSPSNPLSNPTHFSRGASNPERALWMPRPQLPPGVLTPIPFSRINVQPNTPASSNPGLRDRTSISPVSSLTATPTVSPTQQSISLQPSPIERQPSLPLYHRALQEQATHQRERAGAEEAGRLGIPVITGFMGAGERGSVQSGESEFMYGGHGESSGEEGHEEGDEEKYDAGIEGSGDHDLRRRLEGNRGGGKKEVLHSTRASSGVFPE